MARNNPERTGSVDIRDVPTSEPVFVRKNIGGISIIHEYSYGNDTKLFVGREETQPLLDALEQTPETERITLEDANLWVEAHNTDKHSHDVLIGTGEGDGRNYVLITEGEAQNLRNVIEEYIVTGGLPE